MNINRRQFLILTAATVATGCRALDDGNRSIAAHRERVVDVGPVGNYAADGVYNNFRDQGFFVIRNGEKLFALSAICTHRKCKLIGEPDHSFYCKCHGSTFDPGGKVTLGPAKRDLPILPVFVNEKGQLLVTVSAT
ncbi:MAG: Rieske (2Fe-2S) protein [Verrucomicrobiia bacterium]